MSIDETERIENSTPGEMELREYVTVHVADIDGPTGINANTYVENAVVGANVTVRYDVSLGTVLKRD
jgi:UDP-2-acetamido-3-amino-2,3-dideoxy-glucuronate N-acetyltransferase